MTTEVSHGTVATNGVAGHQMVKEEDAHFTMLHPDGTHFRVPKKGLSEPLRMRIRGMACGGRVGMAEGGGSPPAPLPPWLQPPPSTGAQPLETPIPGSISPANIGPAPDANGQLPGSPIYGLPAPTGMESGSPLPPGPPPAPGAAPAPSAPPIAAPGGPKYLPDVPFPEQVKGPDIGGVLKAEEAEKGPILEAAKVEEQKAAAMAAQQQAQADAMKAESERFAATHQTYQQHGEQLAKAIADSKIDPNRLMGSMSTGRKVLSGIAMLFGSLAQGHIGGPNPAQVMLDRDIERDIEAQKEDRSNKQNLYKMNLELSQNDQAAHHLTVADMLQTQKLQMERISSSFQGPEKRAQADAAIADVSKRIETERFQAAATTAAAKQQYSFAKFPYEQQRVEHKNLATAEAAGDLARLPEKERERAVKLPNGRFVLAETADAKKEADKVEEAGRTINSTVGALKAVRDETGVRLPFTEAKAKAESLQAQLLPQLNELAKLTRLSEADVNLMTKMIPDATSIGSAQYEGRLKALEAYIQRKLNSSRATNLPGWSPGG